MVEMHGVRHMLLVGGEIQRGQGTYHWNGMRVYKRFEHTKLERQPTI